MLRAFVPLLLALPVLPPVALCFFIFHSARHYDLVARSTVGNVDAARTTEFIISFMNITGIYNGAFTVVALSSARLPLPVRSLCVFFCARFLRTRHRDE